MVEFTVTITMHRFWYPLARVFEFLQFDRIMPRAYSALIYRATLVNGKRLGRK